MIGGASVEDIRRMFSYEPDTGLLKWRISSGPVKNGTIAGYRKTNNDGKSYIKVKVGKKRHFAHRIIWVILHGRLPTGQIDHIDGDGCNNRLENIRDVTPQANLKNKRRYKNNKTGVTGVFFVKKTGKWDSLIRVNGVLKNLGSFSSIEDAARARKAAEIEYGYHENHGSERPL
jgi:hypothetical protein